MHKRLKNNLIILELLLLLKALVVFVPAAGEFMPRIINALVVIGIYASLINLAGLSFILNIFLKFTPLYLVHIVNALFGYNTVNLPIFLYGMIQWAIWPISITYIIRNNFTKTASRLLYISLIFVLITSITTFWGNISIPGASRYLAAIWSEDPETAHFYRRLNIGGFDFIYLIVLLISVWIYTTKRRDVGAILKITAIFGIIISFITILESQYTTALFFAILSLVLFIMPREFSTKTLVMYFIGGIAFVYFSTTTISIVLNRFADTTEKNVIANRINEVADVMMGRVADGDLEKRQNVIQQSWESFINHPFTGSSNVGGHSFILDTMGYYGIWGLLFVLIVVINLYRLCVKPYKNTAFHGYLLFAFIAQIVLAFMNTTIIFQFFFLFAPLAALVIVKEKQLPSVKLN